MAYNSRFTIVTGWEFPNKDFNYSEEYLELQRLWNTSLKDPLFDLSMEVLRGNRDAIRMWELFAKANNIDRDSRNLKEMRNQVAEILDRLPKSEAKENSNTIEKPNEPPKPPEPKKNGGEINFWLEWYHAMLDNGYKCTLEEVANKSGYSLGYIKQKHMVYQEKSNQNT